MKIYISIWIIILLIIAGCGRNTQVEENDDYIVVDVTAGYPKKELILQDFMDVEYIALETSDEFITQGFVLDIGKDVIIVKNRYEDGDIFIFDRKTGKALKKINRKGHSGEEYIYFGRITHDEANNEIFVNDIMTKKIFVYDLEGKFKRSFKHTEGTLYADIYNFDRKNLICYDHFYTDAGVANDQSFAIISKKDGSITKQIQFVFEKKKLTRLLFTDAAKNMEISVPIGNHFPIRNYNGNWFLVEPSSDTIYKYLPNHEMIPFIVRTPSIQSMYPEVFLFLITVTDRYYFMESAKKVYDSTKKDGLSVVDLIYDKQEKAIFEYTVYNDDYVSKRPVSMKSRYVGEEIATWRILEAYQIVDDYEKGLLKGKLKEIAAELNEESNPVIMLVKHRK